MLWRVLQLSTVDPASVDRGDNVKEIQAQRWRCIEASIEWVLAQRVI